MINYVKEELVADRLRVDPLVSYRFAPGLFTEATEYVLQHQLMDAELWKKFVYQFRLQPDARYAWRGEYWGKMMRGAAGVYRYTQDPALYALLRESVCSLLDCAEPCGRISSYVREQEFVGWDIWCRKYVLLGLQYFSEICSEPALVDRICEVMCRHLDYIVAHIGDGIGQIPIEKTSHAWSGINSCSILEPVLRLWRQTGKEEYMAFAEYIIQKGVGEGEKNLFTLARENKVSPFEYPVVKAYETMSCFEGLAEYYRVTGDEGCRVAIENFAKQVIETDLTVIGCCGCTHELFDHSAWSQTDTVYPGEKQETCVSVTWMKFCLQMLRLTGDVTYADCIEQTFYNAYFGSFNTDRVPSRGNKRGEVLKPGTPTPIPTILPFDSYSPLTADTRGRQTGGYNILWDRTFYGCCACIGSAGMGVLPAGALMSGEDGLTLNFYLPGEMAIQTPQGHALTLTVKTEYPYNGRVEIGVGIQRQECFALRLRIPAWCKKATLLCNGEAMAVDGCGYLTLDRTWTNGDCLILDFDMQPVRLLPPKGACNEELFAAYRRGPLMLAADVRLDRAPDEVFDLCCNADGSIADAVPADHPEIPDARLCLAFKTKGGDAVRLIDYASAGKTWELDSRCAVWLKK